MFSVSHRGAALSFYIAAPFMSPCLGPLVGGFLGAGAGWRWVEGLLAALTGIVGLLIAAFLPETYAPVLLRNRAAKLSRITGQVYRSKSDLDQEGPVTVWRTLRTAIRRPFVMLFWEPIVLILTIYMYDTQLHPKSLAKKSQLYPIRNPVPVLRRVSNSLPKSARLAPRNSRPRLPRHPSRNSLRSRLQLRRIQTLH